jgi:hypothetical protein
LSDELAAAASEAGAHDAHGVAARGTVRLKRQAAPISNTVALYLETA